MITPVVTLPYVRIPVRVSPFRAHPPLQDGLQDNDDCPDEDQDDAEEHVIHALRDLQFPASRNGFLRPAPFDLPRHPTHSNCVPVANCQPLLARLALFAHMFYIRRVADASTSSTSTVRELIAALGSLAPALDDHDRIERVRLFEELKAIAAAAMAVETRDFDRSQRTQQAVDGVPTNQQGRGIAAQIGLARRISPWAAQRWLGWANILSTELPETFALLRSGRITEWRATLVARETLFLSREDRARVDAELAPHLEGWGDRRIEAETKRAAYRLDPHGYLARVRGAEKDRRVTLRPAPDAMARLSALVPVAQGVAAYRSLCQTADTTTTAGGDNRGRGQIMADTLIERITGQATAQAVPVEIELVIPTDTLLNNGDEPGELVGYGPVPAGQARDLALGTDTDTRSARRRIRRLFLRPSTGNLMTMDTKARLFTANERRFIRLRDQDTCRTPWCDAPVRHIDHVTPAGHGGATHVRNGRGVCETCNYAKQAAGWRAETIFDAVVLATPTGHRYSSHPPDPPGRTELRLQTRVIDLVYLDGPHAA